MFELNKQQGTSEDSPLVRKTTKHKAKEVKDGQDHEDSDQGTCACNSRLSKTPKLHVHLQTDKCIFIPKSQIHVKYMYL